jgi:hypothetical protein
MRKDRTERTESPLLTATAAEKGLGSLLLGSAQSRAAARALANARKDGEGECDWNKPLAAPTRLAECFEIARQREERGEVQKSDWKPIRIPPGKENTVRGRWFARLNEAMARMASLEDEREAAQ